MEWTNLEVFSNHYRKEEHPLPHCEGRTGENKKNKDYEVSIKAT